MKTEKEKIAEIASDVRKATRERSEAEHAEVMALKRELEKEERALRQAYEKSRREKLATFYFGLSTLVMTTTVLGGLSPILYLDIGKEVNWYTVCTGFLISTSLVIKANNLLKY